jgi:thioredoxin reductase (NADPH)
MSEAGKDNTPGFPDGIAGPELLARLRKQALRYGAVIREARVEALESGERFTLKTGREILESRFVILASGVLDQLPPFADAEAAVRHGRLRVCPICDAYEAIDRKIAVLGSGEHATREAQFLRHFSDSVTIIECGKGIKEPSWDRDGANAFDVIYAALGCHPRNDLAVRLGATCDQSGALAVNKHQETSVAQIYAVGDVVRGLNQVVVAAAEAAIAATDIHNRLRASFG